MAGKRNQAGVDLCDKRYMKKQNYRRKKYDGASPSFVLSTSFACEIERGAKC
jgi:hypothetical protein